MKEDVGYRKPHQRSSKATLQKACEERAQADGWAGGRGHILSRRQHKKGRLQERGLNK